MAVNAVKQPPDVNSETMGFYAATIAHDLNNILQIALGRNQMAIMRYQDHPVAVDLKQIQFYILKISQYINQMTLYARKGHPETETFEVNKAVEDSLRTIRNYTPHGVAISWDKSKPIYISMDKFQFEQILTNLCLNAFEAMDGVADRKVRVAISKVKEYAVVSVEDTGHGMDEAIKERIFDVYFTTKAKGTGLGLPMVFSIVRQNGGYIDVESAPGQGTKFSIYLPVKKEVIACE